MAAGLAPIENTFAHIIQEAGTFRAPGLTFFWALLIRVASNIAQHDVKNNDCFSQGKPLHANRTHVDNTLRLIQMQSVVCFKDLKTAALYFDRVIPVAFKYMAGTGSEIVANFPEPIPANALVDIVFDREPKSKDEHYRLFGRIVDGWGEFANSVQRYRVMRHGSSLDDDYEDLYEAYLKGASIEGLLPLRKKFSRFAESLEIDSPAVLIPSNCRPAASDAEDPLVRVSGLRLINVDCAAWDQIIEVRRDPESRIRLQRLRSFLSEKYTNKTPAFIEDDLTQRISEYDRARRKHGFEIATGSISALLDSSNIQAATASGLAFALLGGPWLGISAATFIELGKVSLEFTKLRRSMVDWRASHELAYIVEMQERMK